MVSYRSFGMAAPPAAMPLGVAAPAFRLPPPQWNDTAAPFPRLHALHELFEAVVRRRATASALLGPDGAVTYGELDARAAQVADRLREMDLPPGATVAVRAAPGPGLIAALVGVLKAGGAYRVIDAPAGDGEAEAPTFEIEPPASAGDGAARTLPPSDPERAGRDRPDPEGPACVLTETGSDGRTVEVVLPHRAITRLVFSPGFMEFGPAETFLLSGSAAGESSLLEIWAALLHGGRLAIPARRPASPAQLSAAVFTHRVTTLRADPETLDAAADDAPELLRGLRRALIDGPTAATAVLRRLADRLPDTALLRVFGGAETAGPATFFPIQRLPADDRTRLPLGRPSRNVRAYVLDDRERPVAVGAAGRLYLGGPGVALGYRGRPDLNRERFVPDPGSADPSARMFATGERVRFRPDGNLERVGRDGDPV